MHLTAPGNQAQRLSFVHVSRYVTRTRGVQPHGGHGQHPEVHPWIRSRSAPPHLTQKNVLHLGYYFQHSHGHDC